MQTAINAILPSVTGFLVPMNRAPIMTNVQCTLGNTLTENTSATFSISVVCRFLADKFFTFRDITANYGRQFTLYIGACVITLLIGLCVFEVLNYLTDLPFLSKIVSVPFVTVAGYVLFRIIVFRN